MWKSKNKKYHTIKCQYLLTRECSVTSLKLRSGISKSPDKKYFIPVDQVEVHNCYWIDFFSQLWKYQARLVSVWGNNQRLVFSYPHIVIFYYVLKLFYFWNPKVVTYIRRHLFLKSAYGSLEWLGIKMNNFFTFICNLFRSSIEWVILLIGTLHKEIQLVLKNLMIKRCLYI